jgi:hypothetical protein
MGVELAIGALIGAGTGAAVAAIQGGDPLKGALFGAVTGGIGGGLAGSLAGSGTVSVLGTEIAKGSVWAGVAGVMGGYGAGVSEARKAAMIREQQRQEQALRHNEQLLKAQLEKDQSALTKEMEKLAGGSNRGEIIEKRINAARQFAELTDRNDGEELEQGLGNLYVMA